MRIIALALIAGTFTPLPASAQQSNTNIRLGQFPQGITVFAKATIPVRAWLQVSSFRARSLESAESFSTAVQKLGVPIDTIVTAPAQLSPFVGGAQNTYEVSVTARPDLSGALREAARRYRLTAESNGYMTPANGDALYHRALALVVAHARNDAQAIAGADNQRVGRLLSFEPSILDITRELLPAASLSLPGTSSSVTASGLATFELIP